VRAAALRLCEEVHTEVEFEWLRPWAAQGGAHAASHALYWRPRMARLLRAWDRLEARTAAHPNPNPIPYPIPNPNPNPNPKPNPNPNPNPINQARTAAHVAALVAAAEAEAAP